MHPMRRQIARLRADLVTEYTQARNHLIRGRRAVLDRATATREEVDACTAALACIRRTKALRLRIKALELTYRAGVPHHDMCPGCNGEGIGVDREGAWICSDCQGSGEPGLRGAA